MAHNPASKAARAEGCTCPVDKNQHGHGEPFNDGANTRWYLTNGCPVHDPNGTPLPTPHPGR